MSDDVMRANRRPDIEYDLGISTLEGLSLPLDRLVDILTLSLNYTGLERCELVSRTWAAILLSCSLSVDCWNSFRGHPGVAQALRDSLLLDTQPEIRQLTRKLIDEKIVANEE
jgi:hypothetical protein